MISEASPNVDRRINHFVRQRNWRAEIEYLQMCLQFSQVWFGRYCSGLSCCRVFTMLTYCFLVNAILWNSSKTMFNKVCSYTRDHFAIVFVRRVQIIFHFHDFSRGPRFTTCVGSLGVNFNVNWFATGDVHVAIDYVLGAQLALSRRRWCQARCGQRRETLRPDFEWSTYPLHRSSRLRVVPSFL